MRTAKRSPAAAGRGALVASMLVLFVAVSLLSGIATLFSLQKSLQSDLDERVMNQSARFRPDDGDGRETRFPARRLETPTPRRWRRTCASSGTEAAQVLQHRMALHPWTVHGLHVTIEK